ncbi:MAG: hypothetical protein A3J07_01865 [Candidatus Doudnabacteria bacterium RIFCSPLOWO2_02_FULL_49_13]|uniref:Uncharacterized protein n=1 Tax=Candidatus Doudnabacteria bacterium RIFCSPHIGHO2_12_FULL_48_16 TaxID=1817838 RepID=A0A1F5PLK2_9BACT|nr:MAG: hypothetical protein A3B77_00845 [Candidatus Doudnabacteria bacterium RIFCSPHIGHO2_02_FULL_49_24]OGE88794.1 MAG: hypothetical protein A2760_01200 [Candidatus Doudnabacteria bacterium RIFCSPHIGHO2_01_FULL_50_67]OGE90684.1 MAG: hypothetical protein A3E29_00965 [Candidatus Doudnabacteria bacterium RIFCSPHIGHO2_12_FULL_48_16]OGE97015.1 MAG: hypothetical protein A2990_02990 [Candidatus Doudnabacteria bacterium RIFCSPLOWO2_01_FULL_49_40]OGF02549.1 MAG: hypothetical protein A3J07_01865 [Candid
MKKFDLNRILQWLAHILRCPVCGHKYEASQTKIIDAADDKPMMGRSILVHTDCDKCKSSVVFSIAIDGPEIFSIGMVTDLTSQDTSKFKNSQPISSDEVLATHEFLREFDGDFRSILK